MPGRYRVHLQAVVATSAAPYGYTLTIWTSGAVTTHARGIPTALEALLFLAGAVAGFAVVVALATSRIEELAARQESVEEAIATQRAKRPEGAHPDEIAAMLDAIPDMRDALGEADENELIEVSTPSMCVSLTPSPPADSSLPRPSPQSWSATTKKATGGRGTLV